MGGHVVGTRTIGVHGIGDAVLASIGVGELVLDTLTVDGGRYDILPRAVSVEDVVSGDGEGCRTRGGGRLQRGDSTEEIPSLQGLQRALRMVALVCISRLC